MTTKTVAERLMEYAKERKTETSPLNCSMAEHFEHKCSDYNDCGECEFALFKKIARQIEAEQAELRKQSVDVDALLKLADDMKDYFAVPPYKLLHADSRTVSGWNDIIRNAVKGANASKPMPLDADGQPCFLDDAVWHKRRKHLVVAVSHKGKVCIRDWETRDSGKGAVWVKAERVTHRKPDTQDDLEADVEEWVIDNFDGYPVEAYGAITEFLKRQRKLLGGE